MRRGQQIPLSEAALTASRYHTGRDVVVWPAVQPCSSGSAAAGPWLVVKFPVAPGTSPKKKGDVFGACGFWTVVSGACTRRRGMGSVGDWPLAKPHTQHRGIPPRRRASPTGRGQPASGAGSPLWARACAAIWATCGVAVGRRENAALGNTRGEKVDASRREVTAQAGLFAAGAGLVAFVQSPRPVASNLFVVLCGRRRPTLALR